MGLSVHYRGSLTDKKQIRNFIHEMEDIAKSVNWQYRILDEDWSKRPNARLTHNSAGQATIEGELGLKGVILSMHEDCESLNLCFKASGELTSPLQVALSAEEDYLGQPEWVSVKTQFAGPDVHVALVKLLRYLKGKYLHDLEVEDESGYWDTGNYDAIVNNMSLINRAIDVISNQLENSDAKTEDDIIAQIEKALRDLKEREEGEGVGVRNWEFGIGNSELGVRNFTRTSDSDDGSGFGSLPGSTLREVCGCKGNVPLEPIINWCSKHCEPLRFVAPLREAKTNMV